MALQVLIRAPDFYKGKEEPTEERETVAINALSSVLTFREFPISRYRQPKMRYRATTTYADGIGKAKREML